MRSLVFALALLAFAAPMPATAQQDAAHAAIAAITAQEWSTLEPPVLVPRVVAASSRETIERLAAGGDVRAATIAGIAYYYGLAGFPLNHSEAARLLQWASN